MTAVLFATIAFAVITWFGRSAVVPGLPPLTPPPAPLPAFRPDAAPAGGVSPLLLAAIVAPWLLLAVSLFANRENPQPDPEPTPAVGLDLRGRFTGEAAAADAAITAALLDALADAIEHDGQHEKRLTTGTQLAELRTLSREYRTSGVSLGQRQPLARDAIKAYLDQEVGTDGGPVDDAARARWVAAFRAVAKAAAAAIGR